MKQPMTDAKKQLAYLSFVNRENGFRHHYYDEEMKQYEMMKAGDPAAVEESQRMMTSNITGHLSDNPVRNMIYLFIANITITTRFAIEGGMDSETAYTASDMYINRVDRASSVEEVLAIHREMFTFFTDSMAKLSSKNIYSKPIVQAIEYIDNHLHTAIKAKDLSEHTGLSQSYLSTLFKKEMGVSISAYTARRRIDTAKNMLRYSQYSATEIAEFLAFSSQSHFISVFKKIEGMTPNEYLKLHYRESIRAAYEN